MRSSTSRTSCGGCARTARGRRSERRPAADVVRDATLEIRTSIVFATIIIVLVFLPIFGLSGVEGRLLTPLAFAYIVALLASLAVAIVVTPALCYAFLPGRRDRFCSGHDGWLARALKARFARDPAARARSSGPGRSRGRCVLLAGGGRRDDRGWARRSCRSSTRAA